MDLQSSPPNKSKSFSGGAYAPTSSADPSAMDRLNIAVKALADPFPLAAAVSTEDMLLINKFIDYGVQDLPNDQGSRAMHFACMKGNLDIAQLLIKEFGVASLHAANNAGLTALHCACGAGNLELIKWLLLNGSNINCTCIRGKSALHYACSRGHLKVATWLISKMVISYILKICFFISGYMIYLLL